MKDALIRALAAKLAADAKAPAAPATKAAPAAPAKPLKHWAARDIAATVPAVKKPATKVQPPHVVSVPGRASYVK